MEGQPRVTRVTPQRLSFNLDDFSNTREEMTDGEAATAVPVANMVGEHTQPRRELNLLGALETPVATPGDEGTPQTIIPTTVLNNHIMSQQNLTNLVSSLSAQVKAGGTTPRSEDARTTNGGVKEVNDDSQVTKGDLRRMLRVSHSPPMALFDLEPPLTNEVLMASYPNGYQPPTFRKFDGTGSAREHLMSFLDDLGVHRDNANLGLKEFSKSLSGRAFTWYAKLRPNSIKTWEELAMEFCSKFLEEEGALHIMDLGRVKQKSGEGLVTLIKRYSNRALHCKETLPEADLVYGCIKNIEDGSQIFLSLGGITTFAELMKKAADVAEAMKRQGKRSKDSEDMFEEEYDNPIYCILHRTNTHTTTNCWTVRRAFEKQVKLGKVLLLEGEGGDLHRRPLPNHSVSTITTRTSNLRIEEIEEDFQTEEEVMTIGLLKVKGFRVLFSQIGLIQEAQREAIANIVQIAKKHVGM
ncbi:Retrotransposon gag domain [Sesbania bispinosa]|nr:Retrotransposon gag domain [Sesbania bispinosa]